MSAAISSGDLERHTARAIEDLVYQIRTRGDADLEVVVREFMIRLREKLGWRPTAAAAAPPWRIPPGDSRLPDPGKPGGAEYAAVRAQVGSDRPAGDDPHVRVIGYVRDMNDGRLADCGAEAHDQAARPEVPGG